MCSASEIYYASEVPVLGLHSNAVFWLSPVDSLLMAPCHGLTWMHATWPQKLLYHSPSSAEQVRKNMMKGLWVKIRTGRDHSLITVMGKTD